MYRLIIVAIAITLAATAQVVPVQSDPNEPSVDSKLIIPQGNWSRPEVTWQMASN